MLNLRKKTIQDKQQTRGKQVYAIIPAAGSSQRMGGGNKLVMELHGQPILCRTLQVFEACPAIDGIVLVCRKQDQANYASLCADWNISKLHKIVEGGPTREHSVLNGILACEKDIGYVAIHDAARPLITEETETDEDLSAEDKEADRNPGNGLLTGEPTETDSP